MRESCFSVGAHVHSPMMVKSVAVEINGRDSPGNTVINGHHLTNEGESMVELGGEEDTALESTYCDSFREHWRQMRQLIECTDPVSTAEDTADVINSHFQHMMSLLFNVMRPSSSPSPNTNPSPAPLPTLFRQLLDESVLQQLLVWSRRPAQLHERQFQQLQLLQLLRRLVESEWHGQLLRDATLLELLEQLLADCCQSGCRPSTNQYDPGHQLYTWHRAVVMLIDHVFAAVSSDTALLALLLPVDASGALCGGFGPVAVVLLVRYLHCDGVLGSVARDTLLSLVQMSTRSHLLASLLLHCSDFCVMLAAGLGGLYSALPRELQLFPEGRYRQLQPGCKLVPQLHSLVRCLEFCDAVLASCTVETRTRLLELMYHAFLVPVLCPALMEGTMEEKITSVSYLQQFLMVVRQDCLIRLFLEFIVCHETDNKSLLNCLLHHLSSPSKLCVVTLSLFHTLLDFNCEDVLLALMLRHLIPATHLMISQRSRSIDQQLHGLLAGADQLLSLLPLVASRESTCSPLSLVWSGRVSECRSACAASFSCCYRSQSPPPAITQPTTTPAAAALDGTVVRPDSQSLEPATAVDDPGLRVGATAVAVTCDEDTCSLGGSSSGYQSFNLRCSPSPPPPPPLVIEVERQDELFHRLMQQCPSPQLDWRAVSLEQVVETLDAELEQWSACTRGPHAESAADDTTTSPSTQDDTLCPDDGTVTSPPASDTVCQAEQSHSANCSDPPYVGLFLSSLFALLCRADELCFDLNVQLMCLLSRLCLFPLAPLLSFLLDSTLTLQPSVPSLFQALAVLKARVSSALSQIACVHEALERTETEMVVRVGGQDTDTADGQTGSGASWPGFRADSSSAPAHATSRRSFTNSLGVMAAKIVSSLGRSAPGGTTQPIRLSKINSNNNSRDGTDHSTLLQTAVLLEHWLLELAAIAREHALSASLASPSSSTWT